MNLGTLEEVGMSDIPVTLPLEIKQAQNDDDDDDDDDDDGDGDGDSDGDHNVDDDGHHLCIYEWVEYLIYIHNSSNMHLVNVIMNKKDLNS